MSILDGVGNSLKSLGESAVDFAESEIDYLSGGKSSSGGLSRQSSVNYGLKSKETRNIIHWMVPQIGTVQMYVNPASIRYSYTKDIQTTRTKSGYIIQYWGEQLPKLSISGTTGSSGVEGLNVLEEIYRSEQLSYDPYALMLAAKKNEESDDLFSLLTGISPGSNDLFSSLGYTLRGNNVPQLTPAKTPSLAALASQIEMYYSGWTFRGFFTSFNVDESADRLGLFQYGLEFTVTQRRGFRRNYLPWHNSPNFGPSNWDTAPMTYSG